MESQEGTCIDIVLASERKLRKANDPNVLSALQANRELYEAEPVKAEVVENRLVVDLKDGRTVTVPLHWYPRLSNATPKERSEYRLSCDGIHWESLDEDVSVRGMLLGRRSGESTGSFEFWLSNRRQGRKVTLEDYMNHRRRGQLSKRKSAKAAR